MSTTSSNRFRSSRIHLLAMGITITNTTGSRCMAKLHFFLPRGADHRTRLGCLRWSSLIRGHPTTQKINYTTIKWVKRVCGSGRRWEGIIYLTHHQRLHQLQNWKICRAGLEILHCNIKKQKQSTKGLEYAEGTHGMGGTYPPWDERACELNHSLFIALKMEVRCIVDHGSALG